MTELAAGNPVILVVDDSRLMRVAARKILKTRFDIVEAADGEIAWDMLQEDGRITLVMSDLSMPNLDGLGLLHKIRSSENHRIRELPVIIVTGAEDDDGSKKTALNAGASDFITKPFDSVQLLARTQSQVEQHRTRRALRASEDSKQKLEQQSTVDTLTGLMNAQAFRERLEADISYAKRHGTRLAVLQIQVDRYKILFLRKGRAAAEAMLLQLAERLGQDRRQEDSIARTGLDSFAIILPSADASGGRRIAEKIRAGVNALNRSEADADAPFTVSIAVTAPAIGPTVTAEVFLRYGSNELREAKQAGGDCIRCPADSAETVAATPRAEAGNPAGNRPTADTATSDEIRRALDALASDEPVTGDHDRLVRALLPLLRSWSRSGNGQHDGLVRQLERALGPDAANRTPPATGEAG